MNILIQYVYNIFLIISQIISVLLGGHPDTSVSQRTALAFLAHKDKKTLKEKWFTFQMKLINGIFWNILWKVEKNHCLNSIKGEAKAKEVWNWNK